MPRKYIKTGESPEGRYRRLRAFKHNGYMGHVRMMIQNADAIVIADSTTEVSKILAKEISKLALRLEATLKTRVDHEDET